MVTCPAPGRSRWPRRRTLRASGAGFRSTTFMSEPHSPGPACTSKQSPSFARYGGKLNVRCPRSRDAEPREGADRKTHGNQDSILVLHWSCEKVPKGTGRQGRLLTAPWRLRCSGHTVCERYNSSRKQQPTKEHLDAAVPSCHGGSPAVFDPPTRRVGAGHHHGRAVPSRCRRLLRWQDDRLNRRQRGGRGVGLLRRA